MDIHNPSVPATNGINGVNGTGARKSLAELTLEKEKLESELSELSSVLDSHGVNMNTGLTTFDGFPRADIDVPQIRVTRARIIHLRNDYKALMERIGVAVQEQFAALAAQPAEARLVAAQSSSIPSRPAASRTANTTDVPTPFASVDRVFADSPAFEAGVKVGDKIVQFGDANWLNHDNMRKVAEVVQRNEGRPIPVRVLRDTTVAQFQLTPRRDWGGRGLLGCHIVPI